MSPYQTLAHAIIARAAIDYKDALNRLEKRKRDKEAKGVKNECERFFKSRWFKQLTTADGAYLIRKIKESGSVVPIRDVALL